MDLRLKLIRKVILIAILLITLVCIIYFNCTDKKQSKEGQLVIHSSEVMNTPQVTNGRILFQKNCNVCHSLNKTDEIIMNKIVDSIYDKKLLYAFIRNGDSVIKSGNAYYNNLYKEYGIRMTSFPDLADSALDNIMLYIKAVKTFQRLPHY